MWKHYKFDPNSVNFSCDTDKKLNEFDTLLHSEWDRAVTQDLFAFPINYHANRRILDDGDLHYIIEYNRDRQEKRRIAYPYEHVNAPFDNNKFNFNKIKDKEILISLDNDEQTDKHLIIINNAPIHPYHVLLVPDRQLEQTQILTIDCIIFGFEFVAVSAHPYILAGFNSLCAYASINHLHLHGMYFPDRLFLQTIKCSPFHTNSNCYLLDLFHAEAFAFEVQHIDEFNRIAQYVYKITNYLASNNIAHNMAIVKGDSFSSSNNVLRIFVWFRQSVIKAQRFDRCNFACLELAGFMTLHYEEVYNTLTQMELFEHLNEIALSLEEQKRIKDHVKNLLDN
ncbi:unnamed protein product [Rotaria sordida]|uniref:GDP-D-glucose phosphorylase 1 n=1 Tax=Rotaria sordida TaxID=392033 RepID=A0A814DGU9_9BILA|nr:unnamed protein product [Rotaria sordida]CAF0952837.1 unnamed protein product [Rotaria sordida]